VNFDSATVLVTGATSGIGQATAERFGRLGAQVIVSGRDRARGETVVKTIQEAGGYARFVQADLGDSDDVLHLAREAGEVDVLVNNAGGSPFGGTAETSVDVIQNVFAVNVIAPFLLTGQLAPKMGARGGGVIVNVSSHAAGHGIPFLGAYGASKAGIDLLTKAWAVEFGCPGRAGQRRLPRRSPDPTVDRPRGDVRPDGERNPPRARRLGGGDGFGDHLPCLG
jgi:NAD(P)-dependent dehydrogenase (short-subunit alcohol dehydrogenase family)